MKTIMVEIKGENISLDVNTEFKNLLHIWKILHPNISICLYELDEANSTICSVGDIIEI